MSIEPHTGGVFFQVLAVAGTVAAALLLVFATRMRSVLARAWRRITRPEEEIRIQRRRD
jgi:hypothetical protein